MRVQFAYAEVLLVYKNTTEFWAAMARGLRMDVHGH